jgi:8-oxo-dGTP diphosphatase
MKLRLNANAVITNSQGEILLIKLKKGVFEGGLCIPGGGIEPGEMGFETAKREVFEETGIQILNEIKPFGFCELVHSKSESHRVVLLFHAQGEGKAKETEEGVADWYLYEDVKDKLIPFAREAIRIWKSKETHFTLVE